MPTFRFNKIVRDKLPLLYDELDQTITWKILGKDARRLALIADKLPEEADEYCAAVTPEGRLQELADMRQIIADAAEADGFTMEDVERVCKEKFDKKGGFSKGVYVEMITLNEDDKWVKYYRAEPKKYPEVDQ